MNALQKVVLSISVAALILSTVYVPCVCIFKGIPSMPFRLDTQVDIGSYWIWNLPNPEHKEMADLFRLGDEFKYSDRPLDFLFEIRISYIEIIIRYIFVSLLSVMLLLLTSSRKS